MSSFSGDAYPLLYYNPTPTVLYDSKDQEYLIISENVGTTSRYSPKLFDSGSLNNLPGTNGDSIVAKAAGYTSYFVIDQLGSVQVLRMYTAGTGVYKVTI